VTDSPSARLRGIIHQLRTQQPAVSRHQLAELESVAKDAASFRWMSEPMRFALFALLDSVKRGADRNYYIVDREVFIWAMDQLMAMTDATEGVKK
jgi:hypothetical protein